MGQPNAVSEHKVQAEGVSIQSLINGFSKLKVPPYQRDYAWTKEQVDELWNDVSEAITSNSDSYFLGSTVFVGPLGGQVEVVDGQQRLVWVMLVFSALRSGCLLKNDTDRASLIQQSLGYVDIVTLVHNPHLVLNAENNILFQEIMAGKLSPDEAKKRRDDKSETPSNRLLAGAYCNISERVSTFTNGFNDTPKVINLYKAIWNKLIVIRILSPDDVSAYVLFETLNDRGLDLTLSDLLKNYIFSKAGANLNSIQTQWSDVASKVGRPNMTRFIRHDWMSRVGKVRERELYKLLKDKTKNADDVIEYMKNLSKSAETYASLSVPEDVRWNVRGQKVKNRLSDIQTLGITQCYPLLLACDEHLSNSHFLLVLDWIISFSVRYTIIGEKSSAYLEQLYADLSAIVRTSPFKSSEVKSKFKAIMPSDQEFKTNFTERTLSSPKIVRFILGALECKLSANPETIPNLPELTVEHILPEKPDQDWPAKLRNSDLHRALVHRIGNLTLMTGTMNSDVASKKIDIKAVTYAMSTLSITKTLATLKVWDEDAVNKRQSKFADLAVNIWNVK